MWLFSYNTTRFILLKQNIAVVNLIAIKEYGYFLVTPHDSNMWKQFNIVINSIATKQCGYFLAFYNAEAKHCY